MKKIIGLIAVVLLGWAVWHAYKTSTAPQGAATSTGATASVTTKHPDASGAAFIFEDGAITFKNGKSEIKLPDSSALQATELTNTLGYGDLNNDGKEDTAVVIIQTGGGSGTFFYLGAYVSGPLAYKGSNAVFLGDRISPQTVSIKSGVITVTYLDRKPDEPFDAEPTVKTSKTFIVSKGELIPKE
ncbi:MAG: hypothetical protein JWN89_216 [Parcubacteria group bacterium]|nr:hypothetical protein [Parcubacteria group bacterium]